MSRSLRSHYLNTSGKTKIVGISWKGGGRDDRIRQKSISTKHFGELISSFDDVFFVSLQYGDITQGQLADLQSAGATVAVDKRINALKNMDNWLARCL